jgi:hypothetical protein
VINAYKIAVGYVVDGGAVQGHTDSCSGVVREVKIYRAMDGTIEADEEFLYLARVDRADSKRGAAYRP